MTRARRIITNIIYCVANQKIRITDGYITIGVFIITNLYILIYYINTVTVYSVTGIFSLCTSSSREIQMGFD